MFAKIGESGYGSKTFAYLRVTSDFNDDKIHPNSITDYFDIKL